MILAHGVVFVPVVLRVYINMYPREGDANLGQYYKGDRGPGVHLFSSGYVQLRFSKLEAFGIFIKTWVLRTDILPNFQAFGQKLWKNLSFWS